MRINPIKSSSNFEQPAFTGRVKYLTCDMYGGSKCLSSTPGETRNWGDTAGFEYVAKMGHPNPEASAEQTVGTFHSRPTYKVYWADPLEYIDDEARKAFDYIVYDNEPKYPTQEAVSKNYFGESDYNFEDRYKVIRDYYYRMEMADSKTVNEHEQKLSDGQASRDTFDKIAYYKDRINKAKYQQWQAQECLNRYNEAGPLLSRKFEVVREIRGLQHNIDSVPFYTKFFGEQLERAKIQKRNTEGILSILKEKLAGYYNSYSRNKSLDEIMKSERGRGIYVNTKSEKDVINENIKNVQRSIKTCHERIKVQEKAIADAKSNLAYQPIILNTYPAKIKEQEIILNELKAKLIPLFDKLKNFYFERGIIR